MDGENEAWRLCNLAKLIHPVSDENGIQAQIV